MSTTIEYTGKLVVLTCWCGIAHAVPSSLRDEQLREHHDGLKVTGIYCPLGHTHIPSGEREIDRLQKRLERRDEALRYEREYAARLAAERDQAEAGRRAQKAANTRLKKRIHAGVCPHCKRSFANVAKHMASQHPDFVEATDA